MRRTPECDHEVDGSQHHEHHEWCIAKAVVTALYGNWYDHPPYTDYAQAIVEDPTEGFRELLAVTKARDEARASFRDSRRPPAPSTSGPYRETDVSEVADWKRTAHGYLETLSDVRALLHAEPSDEPYDRGLVEHVRKLAESNVSKTEKLTFTPDLEIRRQILRAVVRLAGRLEEQVTEAVLFRLHQGKDARPTDQEEQVFRNGYARLLELVTTFPRKAP
jgi:hypothetical protein